MENTQTSDTYKSDKMKRIQKQAKELIQCPTEGVQLIQITQKGDCLMRISGPQQTEFEGINYIILINTPKDYPFRPPSIQFQSHILHPNISQQGYVCFDSNSQWAPSFTFRTVCLSVQALLSAPNLEDPLNPQAAELFENDRQEYIALNKKYSAKYNDSEIIEHLHSNQKVDAKYVISLKQNMKQIPQIDE